MKPRASGLLRYIAASEHLIIRNHKHIEFRSLPVGKKQVLTDPEYKNNAIKVSDSFHACGGASEAKEFLEEITG